MARNALIQLRRDTAANWTSTNPTLAAGEQGFETDTGKLKIGNGSTAWTSLLYATDASDITGTTLASNVTGSSLTSVGTLTGLTVTGTATVTATSGTAMRITNTGSGNSFLVEDSASTDTSPFVIDASGNVGIGVSSPSTKLEVSGNVQILGGNFVVGGQGTFFNSSQEDGIILAPRIGGTGSYRAIFTPATLSASRTYTLPNVTGTMITTGNLSSITTVGTLSAGAIPSSLLTGQTGMWTSANRPGAYRLYRRDSDDAYNIQTYWTGSRWRLYGYLNDTAHADTHAGFADSATTATNQSGGTVSASYVQVNTSSTSSQHGAQGLQIISTGTIAGLSFWPILHGIAPVLRCWNGHGEGLDCGNNPGTGYAWLGASSFITRCSIEWKDDVRIKNDTEILNDVLAALSIPVVKFNDKYGEPIKVDDEWTYVPTSELSQEHRSEPIQSNHFDREGFIAETVAQVFPKASTFNSEGEPNGTDMGIITAQLLDAVKLLVLQGEEFSRRLSLLENS
jgi:hypothetical protein